MENPTENPVEGYRFLLNGGQFTFAMCGLDIHRNFMQAPSDSYGNKGLLVVTSKEDLHDFLIGVLERVDCEQCGIFVIYNNGDVLYSIKGYDDDGCPSVEGYRVEFQFGMADYSTIGEIAIDECLYLYGLMVEINDNEFKIIER